MSQAKDSLLGFGLGLLGAAMDHGFGTLAVPKYGGQIRARFAPKGFARATVPAECAGEFRYARAP